MSDRDEMSAVFGRGFAHPRLWEHYADDHRGVCLCLDRATLIDRASHNLRHRGELRYGEVRYADAELAREARSVIMSDIRNEPVSKSLDEHVKTHVRELFFTKLKDSESEMEYRLVLPTDDVRPAFIDIRNALRAIVLGENVSDAYLPSLAKPCREQTVQIYKTRWPYGRPRLDPKADPSRAPE